jgi:hypothetical protein
MCYVRAQMEMYMLNMLVPVMYAYSSYSIWVHKFLVTNLKGPIAKWVKI